MSDAYQGGGGWSGGSPLTGGSGGVYGGTDSLLGSYMQPLKQYDAVSGSMTNARPAQSNQQMSSLARSIQAPEGTAATYNTQPQAATPTTPAPVTVNVQAPAQTSTLAQSLMASAPAGMAMMPGRNLRGGAPHADAAAVAAPPRIVNNRFGSAELQQYNSMTNQYETVGTYDSFSGAPRFQLRDAGGNLKDVDQATWQNATNNVQAFGVDTHGGQAESSAFTTKAIKDYADAQQVAQANATIAQQTQLQAMNDRAAQAAAQNALDKAASFNLAGALQAPNTSAVDATGRADMSRLISKYAASGYGPEASSIAALGSRDAGTQATVNKVNHDTAYANSYNTNYGVFTDALKAQRDTSVEASANRLHYDMQGVQDAVSQLAQQASQLTGTAQTKTTAALLPLQKALQDYNLAVSTYKANSDQAKQAAQMVLSLAGSLAAGAA